MLGVLISDKIDFKLKMVKETRSLYSDKGVNTSRRYNNYIYATNTGAPKYIKQKLTELKEEINSNTIIVGDLYTPLWTMDRSSRQSIKKETGDLNNTLDQSYWTDISRTFHPTAGYTFFTSSHGIFLGYDIC